MKPWQIIGLSTLVPISLLTGVGLFRGDINTNTITSTAQETLVKTPTNIETVKRVERDIIVIPGEPNKVSSSGNTANPPQDTGLKPNDEELVNIFKEVGASEAKAYGLMACYKACTESGLSSFQSLGLLGCGWCEGTPGLVQYNHSLGGVTSTPNNPLFIDNTSKADQAIAGNFSTDTGAGTAQWTNGRLKEYAGVLKPYLSAVSIKDCHKVLWKADYEMYKKDFSGNYKSYIAHINEHSSDLEAILVYSYFKYEAGFGNYKNSDKINSYTGTHKKNMLARYSAACSIEEAFKKHKIIS